MGPCMGPPCAREDNVVDVVNGLDLNILEHQNVVEKKALDIGGLLNHIGHSVNGKRLGLGLFLCHNELIQSKCVH